MPSPEHAELAQQFPRKAREDIVAVEKLIKSALVARGIEIRRTHDLRSLLARAATDEHPTSRRRSATLAG